MRGFGANLHLRRVVFKIYILRGLASELRRLAQDGTDLSADAMDEPMAMIVSDV